MSMDRLTWVDYLKHMHRGLFLYFIQPNESQQDEENEHVRIEFDEENAESKDLLKLTIMSPLLETEDPSNDGPQVRLKYSFQLYAVRDPSDFNDKLQTLVFDIGTYSANLYRTRVLGMFYNQFFLHAQRIRRQLQIYANN
jgi:hypothetical protein